MGPAEAAGTGPTAHTEPIESSGFCIHFKLPHYVTFSSGMDNMRKVINVLYGAAAAGKDADDREVEAEESKTSEVVTKDTM